MQNHARAGHGRSNRRANDALAGSAMGVQQKINAAIRPCLVAVPGAELMQLDNRSGLPLRSAMSSWWRAFGIAPWWSPNEAFLTGLSAYGQSLETDGAYEFAALFRI